MVLICCYWIWARVLFEIWLRRIRHSALGAGAVASIALYFAILLFASGIGHAVYMISVLVPNSIDHASLIRNGILAVAVSLAGWKIRRDLILIGNRVEQTQSLRDQALKLAHEKTAADRRASTSKWMEAFTRIQGPMPELPGVESAKEPAD